LSTSVRKRVARSREIDQEATRKKATSSQDKKAVSWQNLAMTSEHTDLSIDDYLRERLMPVEGSIPRIPGIEMYGNSVPVETVGGDLFEYINFQQRYDIDVRIQQAEKLSKEFLDPLPAGATPRNSVDDHVQWMESRPGYLSEMEVEYRAARSSEQVRVAEALNEPLGTIKSRIHFARKLLKEQIKRY